MNHLELLEVYNFDKKKRYGSTNDGGYVIAELGEKYDCYISCGISDEESFSRDFIDSHNMCEYNSFGFDGTINNYPYQYTKKISFIKKNINNFNDDNNSDLSFLIDKYNNIFLKMDIEGGEYPWLSNLDETQLNKFKQIVIEFHGITNDDWNAKYSDKVKCFEKLSKTHYIVHAHGNNYGRVINGIPDVIELTYVNKTYFNLKPDLNSKPLPDVNLDFSNVKDANDINLNFYPFVKINEPSNYDKVIHITYKSLDKLENIKNQWLELNPDHKVELYDDEKCLCFLEVHYGKKYCDIFNYIQDGAIKCDFFRVCLLYICGGVYVDADVKPLVPLSEYIHDDVDFVTCLSYNYRPNQLRFNYNPHFIIAKKYNTFMYDTIKKYENYYDHKKPYSYWEWSICQLFNIDNSFDINISNNVVTVDGKKYQFLIENILSNGEWYNFTNIFDENGIRKIEYCSTGVCKYNGIDVLENFTNKNLW